MTATEVARRVIEQFDDAFNCGDLETATSCFAEDSRNHRRQVGWAGGRRVLEEIKTIFPDARLAIQHLVAEGEWVAVRCTYSGTHRGMASLPVDGGLLIGVPPTERSFEVQHIHIRVVRWQTLLGLCIGC